MQKTACCAYGLFPSRDPLVNSQLDMQGIQRI